MSRLFNTNSEAVQNAVLWQINSVFTRAQLKSPVCIFCKGMMNEADTRSDTDARWRRSASEITCVDVDAK